MAADTYDGIPLDQLPIEGVIWTPERVTHIRGLFARR